MCTYPIQQQKAKKFILHSPTNEAFQRTYHPFATCPIGSTYTALIIVPITLPSHKPTSYPTCVPGSNLTTNQSQVPNKKPSEFQSIVPSLEHYDNNSFIISHINFVRES